jgi:transcriptional regulator with XRE-family HTH domain
MNLRGYLTETRTSVAVFARLLGVHPQAVHRYLTGERMPRKRILKAIAALTDGAVTADSFIRNTPEPASDALDSLPATESRDNGPPPCPEEHRAAA